MKKYLIWTVAVFITLATLVYQRMTGPTYPLRGKAMIGDAEISYRLPRSHETVKDCEVRIRAENRELGGYLEYKRFKTDDPWRRLEMARDGDLLAASLPKQPAAGKLAYRVVLIHQGHEVSLAGENPIVIRFRDPVPSAVIILHVIVMFLAMLFSVAAGITALDKKSNPRRLVVWTTALLIIGGIILGPIVQKYAFGVWWTGFPFGHDLTDNKTLIALIGWVAAVVAGRKGKPARGWVVGGAVLMLVIFLIPHSLLGSELDYAKMNQPK